MPGAAVLEKGKTVTRVLLFFGSELRVWRPSHSARRCALAVCIDALWILPTMARFFFCLVLFCVLVLRTTRAPS